MGLFGFVWVGREGQALFSVRPSLCYRCGSILWVMGMGYGPLIDVGR